MSRLPRLPEELHDIVTTSGTIAVPYDADPVERARAVEAVQAFRSAHGLTEKQFAAVVRAEVRLLAAEADEPDKVSYRSARQIAIDLGYIRAEAA